MKSTQPRGLTLDAGALIALERGSRTVRALIDAAHSAGLGVAVPAGALAQAWRDGARQAALARLVNNRQVTVVGLDEQVAKAAGILCGRSETSDVVDASVVICARLNGHLVATTDPDDIRALDLTLRIAAV